MDCTQLSLHQLSWLTCSTCIALVYGACMNDLACLGALGSCPIRVFKYLSLLADTRVAFQQILQHELMKSKVAN